MKRKEVFLAALSALALSAPGGARPQPEDFFTKRGEDVPFSKVLASGQLTPGQNSREGFEGPRIRINRDLLEGGPNSDRRPIEDILIHTLGHSAIREDEFSNWSRWYQTDGNTQIFRLFKGEENQRNSRKLAARIEAHSEFKWQRGEWQEFAATYTIIKPHNCAIFQAKNPLNDWSVMINMNDDGDVKINHRQGDDKTVARNMVGKPFHLRIRENGHDYEVYFNGRKEGEGSYDRPRGSTNFRWGMYLGAKEVRHDAMILVTGAAINPDDSVENDMIVENEEEETSPPSPPEKEILGLALPVRTWGNMTGNTITAEARYEIGAEVIHLRVDEQWVAYPLEQLSEADQRELLKLHEAFE